MLGQNFVRACLSMVLIAGLFGTVSASSSPDEVSTPSIDAFSPPNREPAPVGNADISALEIRGEPGVPASSRHRARLGPRLASRMNQRSSPGEMIRFIVSMKRDDLSPPGRARRDAVRARQDRVIGAVRNPRFEPTHRFRSLSGFVGRGSSDVIEALRQDPEVMSIQLDYPVRANLVQGNALIGADLVKASGLTGAGVTIAVLDSGIDTDHPDLVDDLVAEACFCDDHISPSIGCCPSGDDEEYGPGSAEDDDGHGTHVAGIISSGGVVSGEGVAPDAGIVAIKVLDESGNGFTSGVAAGLDWVLTNHATYGINIVNASLGDGGEHDDPLVSPCTGTVSANAISMLHAAGIAVFAASGNDGFDDGISEPACVSEAISVGGVYDASLGSVAWCANESCSSTLCTDSSSPDEFVCHTNSDEILDILAPNWRSSSPEMGGGSAAFGGTSAASPYAAGQAALLLEHDPNLSPDDLRTFLTTHGPMVTNSDNGLSFRRSDVGEALASLAECGDGVLDFGEACDDMNLIDGDCCSSTCEFESAGSACDDDDTCTESDACDGAGACIGTSLDCDDTNECTDDSCDPVLGCVNIENAGPCEDGDACTTGDTCSLGACVAGVATNCDDGNACTDDLCDSALGCIHSSNTDPCDDGDVCTTSDECSLGECVGGLVIDCDDANVCTSDSCDAVLGCVNVSNLASCDDNDPCTAESCDELTGCAHTPIPDCGAPIPSGSRSSRGLLVIMMLVSLGLLTRLEWRRSTR